MSAVRFLVNPAAGRGRGASRLDRLRVLAGRAGAGLVVSKSAADLAEQARRAAADGVERLVVAGGDGTMHWAVQGLAGTRTALGVVPAGSGNDLAATLGVPCELDAAVARALGGEVRPLDLVRAGGRLAIGYAGVGFDSEVTRVANAVTFLRGPLVYPYAVFRTLASFQPPSMRVEHDGGVFEGRAMFAVAANLPRFGGGMMIAPDARPDDGLLDLVIVEEIPRYRLLAVFPRVYKGTHITHPAVTIVRTRSARLTIDRTMEMYGGGEALLPLQAGEPVEVEVVPGGVLVVG